MTLIMNLQNLQQENGTLLMTKIMENIQGYIYGEYKRFNH